jgi:sarcosine oxidase subunit beta
MERADVAVIGAGAIGLACAAELSGRGLGVTILEALPSPGQASSAKANGGVRAQFTTTPNVAFSLASIETYERFARDTGLPGFRQHGYLLIAGDDATEAGLRAARDLQRSLGVDTAWLEADEVLARAPFVRAEGIRGGTFHARDGLIDPAGVVATFERLARVGGVEVRTGAAVTAIEADGEGFRVRHGGEEVRAGVVVNAAGSRAREVAAMLGADVPVEPVRRNLALFLDAPGEPTPMVVDVATGVLVRREGAGGWVVAYSNPADPPGFDETVDPRFFEDLAERTPVRFPFLEGLPLDPARCWAGLYPETPDHHAIVGADPGVPDLVHCVGFGGHGVMHAPAAGRAVAELVADGNCSSFDLRPLRPSRFVEGDLVVETAVL